MKSESISPWYENPNPNENNGEKEFIAHVEYYQQAFFLFHDELKREGYRSDIPHPIRERFWGLLLNRIYEPYESRPLLHS